MSVDTHTEHRLFDQRVRRATGIVALTVVVLWMLKDTAQVFLLVLTAVLLAIFFQRLAARIRRQTKWNKKAALAFSIISSIVLLALTFWFIGAKVQVQVAELTDTLPTSLQKLKAQMAAHPTGSRLMQLSGGGMAQIGPSAKRFFTTSFGVLGDLYVVLFLGIFFTIAPDTYVQGLLRLFPVKARTKAQQVFAATGTTLGHWLKGQLIAMLIVAVLTWIGLAILGVPMALALAIMAGLFNFVPNLGPLVAMVPAVLVGLLQGTNTALLVAGLYLLVQALESNLITPYIQNRMIEIPPALILIGQLLAGTLLGISGIILATPLVAILMVVIRELYVKRQEAATNSEPVP